MHRATVRRERVLVTGASGGVGLAAVQRAKRRGATVIAICSAAKAAEVIAQGADQTVDRGTNLVEALRRRSIDVVIDIVGGTQWPQLLEVLRRGGRYAVAGAIGGPIPKSRQSSSVAIRAEVDRINDRMDVALVGHNESKTALDVACWDIFGKSAGLPVSEILGGGTGVPLHMISSIYAGDPEDMRHRVADHRAKGYLGHSMRSDIDSEGGPALDAERIAACLADKRPGEFFVVDANGGLLPETALRMLRMLPDGLDFVIEAPCATLRETMSLRKRCPYPIVIDELAPAGRGRCFHCRQ